MWTIGYDDSDGNRVTVAWFIAKHDAQMALRHYPIHVTVEWVPDAQIVSS